MAPQSTPMTRLTPGPDTAHQQRDLRAVKNAREQIASVDVGAEPVPGAGGSNWVVREAIRIMRLGRTRCRPGHVKVSELQEQGQAMTTSDQQAEEPGAEPRRHVPLKPAPGLLVGLK